MQLVDSSIKHNTVKMQLFLWVQRKLFSGNIILFTTFQNHDELSFSY